LCADIQITEGIPLGVSEAHHHVEELLQGFFPSFATTIDFYILILLVILF
jgi:hypothetical protein